MKKKKRRNPASNRPCETVRSTHGRSIQNGYYFGNFSVRFGNAVQPINRLIGDEMFLMTYKYTYTTGLDIIGT